MQDKQKAKKFLEEIQTWFSDEDKQQKRIVKDLEKVNNDDAKTIKTILNSKGYKYFIEQIKEDTKISDNLKEVFKDELNIKEPDLKLQESKAIKDKILEKYPNAFLHQSIGEDGFSIMSTSNIAVSKDLSKNRKIGVNHKTPLEAWKSAYENLFEIKKMEEK